MSDAAPRPTVLVLDDEKNIRRSIALALGQEGLHVVAAHDPAAALRTLHERIVDLLILDIRLGEVDGLAFFRRVQAEGFDVPAIFISGHATLTEAAEAVKLGGFDFLEKPFSVEKLAICVTRCLEYHALKERLRRAETQGGGLQVVGDSAAIRKVTAEALRVAATSANVLITGESGTGKELIANTIHAHSERREAPFVKVNCSAIPEHLVESELFGYEKGAFTGATSARRGLFEVAHRGTMFLDEVADLSLAAQAKILRVLQSGDIRRLGAETSMRVDVRILSGTHKNLRQAAAASLFREDLFYRLNVVPLRMPSLRERPEDIPLLCAHLMKRICDKNNLREKPIDEEVFRELRRHPWPGNVRELENALERMIIMSGERITALDLPDELLAPEEAPAAAGREGTETRSALRDYRDNAEREFIIGVLRRHNGNVSQSALELGVGRTYLHKRLAVLKIAKKDFLA